MQRISEELYYATLGFATRTYLRNILNMCTALGGFLATAIKLNPKCESVRFSLPPFDKGYNVLLPRDQRNCVRFLDITMLAADMGVTNILEKHLDARRFLPC
jgi:hypothetical protein